MAQRGLQVTISVIYKLFTIYMEIPVISYGK
jgi:hypothetical protein